MLWNQDMNFNMNNNMGKQQNNILQGPSSYSASLQQNLPPQQQTTIMVDDDNNNDNVKLGFFDIVDVKYYIKSMILLIIIYFILSLEPIKSFFGKFLTPINVLPDGTVSYWGFILYGTLLAVIYGFVLMMLDYYK